MKDRKKVPEHTDKTPELQQSADVASDDDTKRVRTLTVEEFERLMKKDKKPDR